MTFPYWLPLRRFQSQATPQHKVTISSQGSEKKAFAVPLHCRILGRWKSGEVRSCQTKKNTRKSVRQENPIENMLLRFECRKTVNLLFFSSLIYGTHWPRLHEVPANSNTKYLPKTSGVSNKNWIRWKAQVYPPHRANDLRLALLRLEGIWWCLKVQMSWPRRPGGHWTPLVLCSTHHLWSPLALHVPETWSI